MSITPSYLELCVKLYIGQENLIKHLPCKYVTSDLRLYSIYFDCQCCYSVCKPDIDRVLVVHPVERPARAYRNTSRAPRGRCLDPHVQVFLLDEHLGQGRYPIQTTFCPLRRLIHESYIYRKDPKFFDNSSGQEVQLRSACSLGISVIRVYIVVIPSVHCRRLQ